MTNQSEPGDSKASPAPALADANQPVAQLISGSCPGNGKVMLEPEALEVMHINSDSTSVPTARGLGFTGAGVRIAIIADGIDPQNVNFLRANGKSSIVEYLDFTGDGLSVPVSGGEAFLDSSAVGGQGLHTYDVSQFSTQALPTPCNVRIEGASPGADMVALKGFSATVLTTNAAQLTAVDYAISEGKNDIINESFGSNLIPDSESLDVLEMLNSEAVRRGIVVVTASGDSGPSNTLGNPGITAPEVINMGASTTFRFYAQTNYGLARYFSTGWLNDNLSALSSGGFGQTGRTVDMIAPGDSSFVSCSADVNYQECQNLLDKPSELSIGGGTSESAPLTSGVVAMMIEAYKQSHGGLKPTPALVKQILTSTAMDTSTLATQQGSGLVNAYKAVLLSSVVNGGRPTSEAVKAALSAPSPAGGLPLWISKGQLNAVGLPGSEVTWPVKIANPTPVAQTVHLNPRTLGDEHIVGDGIILLTDSGSGKVTTARGDLKNFEKIRFIVPAGADHLKVSFAYQGTKAVASLTLIDPNGKLAAYSEPQGVGNHGQVDVRAPAAGEWVGVLSSLTVAKNGVSEPIPWQATIQNFVSFGRVDLKDFNLAPGETKVIHLFSRIPLQAGDTWGSLQITSSQGGSDVDLGPQISSVAVTLRSLVNVEQGGNFGGVFTGGIGRDPLHAQTNYYQFQVNPGHESLTVDFAMSIDPKNILELYLIDPSGQAVAFGKNIVDGINQVKVSTTTLKPVSGLWTLAVDLGDPVVGDAISQNFAGQILLDRPVVASTTLPQSAGVQLTEGVSQNFEVIVTNTTNSPQAYFVDARLDSMVTLPLLAQIPNRPETSTLQLNFPLQLDDVPPSFAVPTQSSSIDFLAVGSEPFALTFSSNSGDPSLWALAKTAQANQTYKAHGSYKSLGGPITPGYWGVAPGAIGATALALPSGGHVTCSANVVTKAFDRSVTSTTGDYWLSAIDASVPPIKPVVVQPGQTVSLQVTITPSGKTGDILSGKLYINEYVSPGKPDLVDGANEVAEIPYKYSIQ